MQYLPGTCQLYTRVYHGSLSLPLSLRLALIQDSRRHNKLESNLRGSLSKVLIYGRLNIVLGV